MSEVPILQAGDYIHVQSPMMERRMVDAIIADYKKHRVIIEGWSELPDLHEIKIVAIFRPQPGKDPVSMMAAMQNPLYPPMARAR